MADQPSSQSKRCSVTVVGPPEFDKFIPACWTCPWTGPEYDEQMDASDAAKEHQRDEGAA